MGKESVVCIHNGALFSHEKNNILSFVTMWMNLEGIILSEISWTEKDKYCKVLLTCGILKQVKLIEIRSRVVVARGFLVEEIGRG